MCAVFEYFWFIITFKTAVTLPLRKCDNDIPELTLSLNEQALEDFTTPSAVSRPVVQGIEGQFQDTFACVLLRVNNSVCNAYIAPAVFWMFVLYSDFFEEEP